MRRLFMLDDGGRVFVFDREESYVKPTGEAGLFAVWKTTCQECGRAIEATTSPRCAGAVLHFARVNCEEHKGARKKKPPPADQTAARPAIQDPVGGLKSPRPFAVKPDVILLAQRREK